MKRKYLKRISAISIELRRIRDLCTALEKDMSEDETESDYGDDSEIYVNFSDGCVFVDDAVNCFIGFETEEEKKT